MPVKLELTVEIAHPRERVFRTYRDHLVELVPFLPNVRSITLVSREDDGPTSRLLNLWKGGGELPAMVRKFVPDDLLQWEDHAVWHADRFTTEWRTVVPALKEAVRASGVNRFEAVSEQRTVLQISGTLEVDGARIRGVPRLLAGTVGTAVEGFLTASIRPNLLAISAGVEKFLSSGR